MPTLIGKRSAAHASYGSKIGQCIENGPTPRWSPALTAVARWSCIAATGLTACNDPVQVSRQPGDLERAMAADAADERRYQQLAAEQPEEGGDETLH